MDAIAQLKRRTFALLELRRGDRVLDVGCGPLGDAAGGGTGLRASETVGGPSSGHSTLVPRWTDRDTAARRTTRPAVTRRRRPMQSPPDVDYTKATKRQKAASPPMKRQGKQPTVTR